MITYNQAYLARFDELIAEGSHLWDEFKQNPNGIIMDIISFTKWSTSCLNLLDKLSVSTNRFVAQFEIWVVGGPGQKMNIGAALGVLKSAREEYSRGLAIDYHLAVSATVFSSLLDEGKYLIQKRYLRAAMVIIGAALEEGLKARARAIPIDVGEKDTLYPMINKLKQPEIAVLTALEAKQLEVIAKLRNDAAHGGAFEHSYKDISDAHDQVELMLRKLLKSS